MKKFSSIFRLLFIAIFISGMLSCEKKEDNTPPSLTFTEGNYVTSDTTVEPEAELVFNVKITAGSAGLKWIQVKELSTGTSAMGRTSISGTEYEKTITITAPIDQGEYIYEFTVMDESNQETSESITVEVVRTPGEVVKFMDITLGGFYNPKNTNFFSCQTGEVYTLAEASENQELIDIVVLSHSGIDFASPTAPHVNGTGSYAFCSDWDTKHTTIYYHQDNYEITAEDFDTINDDNLFYNVEGFNQKVMLEQYFIDTVFGFEIYNGKKGIIRINSLESQPDGTSVVNFDIIMQK